MPEPLRSSCGAAARQPIQTTLLTLGALLLSVAGTIFTGLAWGHLGIGARAGVLVVVTALAVLVTVAAYRRELRATADATACLTMVLTALDLHALRLVVVPGLSWSAWAAASAALATLIGFIVAGRLRLPSLALVAAALGQAVLPLVLVAGLTARSAIGFRETVLLTAFVVLGTAVADLVAVHLLPEDGWVRIPRTSVVVWGLAQLIMAGALATGATFAVGHPEQAVAGAAELLLVAVVCGVAAAGTGTRSDSVAATFAGGTAISVVLAVVGLTLPSLPGRSVVGTHSALFVPALVGLACVAVGGRLPLRLRTGPLAVGTATSLLVAAPAIGPAIAGLTAPLVLVARPWTFVPPARVGDLAVLPGAVGRAELADCLLLASAGGACALLGAGWPERRVGSAWTRPAGWTAVAALLLVPTAADLRLPLAQALALLVVTALGCRLVAGGVPGPVALVAMLAVVATALARSAASPVLTLTTIAVLTLLCGLVAISATEALRPAATSLGALGALVLVPLLMLARGADGSSAGAVLAATGAGTALLVDRATPSARRFAVLATAAVVVVAGTLRTAPAGTLLPLLLAGLGVVALAGSVRPRRGALAPLGGVLLLASCEIELARAGVTTPEAFTLPAALLALLVGGVARRRRPDLDATVLLGPGLALALLPSLLISFGENDPLRPLLLTVAACAVVLAGAVLRLRAPLAGGAATLTAVALRQLAPLAAGAPRWVVLALLGLVLLALGARYERTRDEVDRWRRSFARMS